MIRDFTRFSNANRPAVCPDGDLIAVGTDHHDASQHFLSVMSGSASAQHTSRTGALACYQAVSEFTTDVKWLDSTRMVVASGRGNLSVHQLTKATTSTSTIRTTGESRVRVCAVWSTGPLGVLYRHCVLTVGVAFRLLQRLCAVRRVRTSAKWRSAPSLRAALPTVDMIALSLSLTCTDRATACCSSVFRRWWVPSNGHLFCLVSSELRACRSHVVSLCRLIYQTAWLLLCRNAPELHSR